MDGEPVGGQIAARQRMTKDEWGCHVSDVEAISAGTRYEYLLDDKTSRPDPCSLWQPDGVFGSSAVVFPEDFVWTDHDWQPPAQADLVFYELHVGTFTPEGTFEAIIPRLRALKELGITAIELMPLAQFSGKRNWGYDGVGWYAPQNTYGGPAGLQALVDAAHREGLAVFLDVVYNHLGPEGSFHADFGPYFSDRYRTAWGPGINYDGPGSDMVRAHVLANIDHWLRHYHIDGLRLDAVHSMFDNSPIHILREAKETADALTVETGRPKFIVVESLMNDIRMVRPTSQGGYGLDAEWSEDFHHALLAFLTGERNGKYIDFGGARLLTQVLNETYALAGGYSRFRRRRWGHKATDVPGDKFVVGIQNHDHVGNRAQGERLAKLVSAPAQRMMASLMLLSPHLPFLFMGEEYGEDHPFLFFCDFGSESLCEAVRSGRRRDYALEGDIPDPLEGSSRRSSVLDWTWSGIPHRAGLRALYQDLLRARREWPVLKDFRHRHASLWPDESQAHILMLLRGLEGEGPGTLRMLFNLTAEARPLEALGLPGEQIVFSSESTRYDGVGGTGSTLQPYECQVRRKFDNPATAPGTK